MFRHQYPTRACVIGKTTFSECQWGAKPLEQCTHTLRGGRGNASGSANCQYQAVKGLGSGDMANRCEPLQASSRLTGARYCPQKACEETPEPKW
jgi:hypothetical protein